MAHGHAKPSSTKELTRAAKAAGFPARELWVISKADRRVMLDVQGLKVRDNRYCESHPGACQWILGSVSPGQKRGKSAADGDVCTVLALVVVSELYMVGSVPCSFPGPVDANAKLRSSRPSQVTDARSLQTRAGFCLFQRTTCSFSPALVFLGKVFILNTEKRFYSFEKFPTGCTNQCGGCVSKGEAALKGVPGVQEATINLATSTATVALSGESTRGTT